MARELVKSDIPKVKSLVKQVFGTDAVSDIARMGGLTNHTYEVLLENGEKYVVRLPGEGTEDMICRGDEKVSTELACKLGIDAELLYFGEDGAKVTRFITNAQTMSKETLKDPKMIALAAENLKILHTCGVDTKVPFEVFAMAEQYENIINGNNVPMYDDYAEIKQRVMDIKARLDSKGVAKPVPCHNDPLCENWVYGDGKMYLIDWEYAGMNDGMWDLADVSIEADFGDSEDTLLLYKYLGKEPTALDRERFLANKLYLDYLWTLWGKTRVPFDGDEMEQYAAERYDRLKQNIKNFVTEE